LVDPEKDKIGWRGRLTAFASKQVFEALFAPPWRGNKWDARKKMTDNDDARPKNTDDSVDQETMTPEPVHAGRI
jgi:hypothetical protein